MARPSRLLALPAIIVSAFVLLGCENDAAPKPESAAKSAPVAQKAPTPAAAAPNAGACGMTAEEEKEHAGGCGQVKAAQAPAAPPGCGCGSHDTGNAERPVVPITEAKLGDRTRCPVTNSVFVVKTDSPKAEHDGKTYHFCCEGCVTRFVKDPKQFLES